MDSKTKTKRLDSSLSFATNQLSDPGWAHPFSGPRFSYSIKGMNPISYALSVPWVLESEILAHGNSNMPHAHSGKAVTLPTCPCSLPPNSFSHS